MAFGLVAGALVGWVLALASLLSGAPIDAWPFNFPTALTAGLLYGIVALRLAAAAHCALRTGLAEGICIHAGVTKADAEVVALDLGDDALWIAGLPRADGPPIVLRAAAMERLLPADEVAALTSERRCWAAAHAEPLMEILIAQQLRDLAISLVCAPLSAEARRTVWHLGVIRACANADGPHIAAAAAARLLPALRAPEAKVMLRELGTPTGAVAALVLLPVLPAIAVGWCIVVALAALDASLRLRPRSHRAGLAAITATIKGGTSATVLLSAHARVQAWPGLPRRLWALEPAATQGEEPRGALSLGSFAPSFGAVHRHLVQLGAATLGGAAMTEPSWMLATAARGSVAERADR